MEVGKTFYSASREEWRSWLKTHHKSAHEIWFLFPKRSSKKPSMVYNDAVEEALCFGWIDSIRKAYDNDTSAQRFTPRRMGSPYSQTNKERIKWLAEKGMLHASMSGVAKEIKKEKFEFPEDIIGALKKNEQAWKNWKNFSPSYQRIRTAYVDAARKRPDEFAKRLRNLIKKSAANKQVGYGGIEKYF